MSRISRRQVQKERREVKKVGWEVLAIVLVALPLVTLGLYAIINLLVR